MAENMASNMKKINRGMSILMGVTLSLCLSFVGIFSSGSFTVAGFVISFLESLVVSLIIGMYVPMRKISESACAKAGIKDKPLACRFLESFISDLIYTPVITIVMVTIAYSKIKGPRPPYPFMLGKSLLISLVIAYLLIFLVTPYFIGFLMKRYGPGKSEKP